MKVSHLRRARTMELKRSISLKRNTLVLFAVLVILAIFGWAGWANWEYRQQAAEKAAGNRRQGRTGARSLRRHAEI